MDTQQTTEPTAAPAPVLPEGGDDASLDTRASALLEQLQGEQKSAAREAAHPSDPEAPVVEAKPKVDKPVEGAPVAKTPEQIAEERRTRLAARDALVAQMAEAERTKVAASRSRKQERQPEPVEAPTNGVTITDAASFFQAAEKLQIPPNELAAWLTGQQDPAKAAEAAAKRTLSPVEQKLKELEAKQAQWEQQQAQAAEQHRVNAIVEQNHQLLANHLDSVKSEAPLASAFQAKSPAKFRRVVESICDGLPPGFTAQDVIDQLEEDLSDLQLNGSSATSPTSTTKPTPKPAAAKANVGNRLAAERATTVEDDGDDAEGDLDERARKLKALLVGR